MSRLEYPSFDGAKHVRVGHGQDCVLIMVETPAYGLEAGIVLSSKNAASLGRRLIQQARASQRLDDFVDDPIPATETPG